MASLSPEATQAWSLTPMDVLATKVPGYLLSPSGRIPKKMRENDTVARYQEREIKRRQVQVDPSEAISELRDLLRLRQEIRDTVFKQLLDFEAAREAWRRAPHKKLMDARKVLDETHERLTGSLQEQTRLESKCQATHRMVNEILARNAPKSLCPEQERHHHIMHSGDGWAPGKKEACVCCALVDNFVPL